MIKVLIQYLLIWLPHYPHPPCLQGRCSYLAHHYPCRESWGLTSLSSPDMKEYGCVWHLHFQEWSQTASLYAAGWGAVNVVLRLVQRAPSRCGGGWSSSDAAGPWGVSSTLPKSRRLGQWWLPRRSESSPASSHSYSKGKQKASIYYILKKQPWWERSPQIWELKYG